MIKRAAIIALITACVFAAGCAELRQAAKGDKPMSDPKPCFYEVLQADRGDLSESEFAEQLDKCAGVIQSRLDAKGMEGASAFVVGSDSIRIELPEALAGTGVDTDEVFSFATRTGLLELRNAAEETKLTGADVEKAYATTETDMATGYLNNVVSLTFTTEGAKKFGDLTKEAYENGTDITLTLDGNVISTAGVNNGPIYGGEALIQGSFTADEASDLAMQINSGILPLQLRLTDSGNGMSENPRLDDKI